MAISRKEAVQGLAALMFGQAVGTASAARFEATLQNDPSIYNLANNLAETEAFGAQFGIDSDRQDKIDLILGRLGLEEGSVGYERGNDFINARLDAGVPAGQVIAEIGEKLLGDTIPRGLSDASDVLRQAIEDSNAHLEAGNEGNAALQMGGGVTTALIAQAIEQAEAAVEARLNFLLEAAQVEAIADELDSDDFDAEATAQAISANYDSAADVLAGATEVENFASRTATAQDALVAEAVAGAQSGVTSATNELENGVVARLETVEARLETLNDATEAATAARTALTREEAGFNAVNDVAVAHVAATEDTSAQLTIDGEVVATQRDDGTYEIVSGSNVGQYNGFQDVLDAANASGRADVAAANDLTALEQAIVATYKQQDADFDGDDFNFDNVISSNDADEYSVDFGDEGDGGLFSAYLDARDNLADLNEAVADFQEARDLRDQLAELNSDRADALSVITEDYDFNIITDFNDATDGNDLYIFSDDTGSDNDIDNFGEEGTDYIFFGEGYTAVALAEGQTIENRVGSADTLEIFWNQDGDNLVLYVEADATAGNSTSNADITEITLTGVNVDDVDFSNGFLSVNAA